MSATRREGEIVLSGPPRNATAVVPLDIPSEKVVPISISVADEATIYRAIVRPFGGGRSEIRLRLPGDTPPGLYRGEGSLGGKPRGIVIEVEADLRLRVQPRQTILSAPAGSSVEFSLNVLNGGNVPYEVPKTDTFDFDDDTGQDLALGRSLRAPLSQGERRVDRFFEELRDSHGGQGRVMVKYGAGPLEPGDARELTCVLEVPAEAREGRTYLGAWQLGNSAHLIVASIIGGGRTTNGRVK